MTQWYSHDWKLVEEYPKDDLVISLVHHLTHLPNEVLNKRSFSYHMIEKLYWWRSSGESMISCIFLLIFPVLSKQKIKRKRNWVKKTSEFKAWKMIFSLQRNNPSFLFVFYNCCIRSKIPWICSNRKQMWHLGIFSL